MAKVEEGLYYSTTHEWVKVEGEEALVEKRAQEAAAEETAEMPAQDAE